MKLYEPLIFFWVLLALFPGAGWAEEQRPPFYPFKVTIGGQEAKLESGVDLFAVIQKPVPVGALLEVGEKTKLLMASAYPCKADGTVLDGDKVIDLFAQNSASLKLVATLKKEVLPSGTYLMTVFAHGKSARVLVTLADPLEEMEAPSAATVLMYLKGES